LLGNTVNGTSAVTEAFLTQNIEKSRVSFTISPEELFSAYKRAEMKGEEVVGIFHSHPAPPYPSSIDRDYMELNPVVWLIMSMPSRELGACQLVNEEIKKVDVRIRKN
jgi:proteasome lid subunit RPN8/RPN11